MSKELSGNSKDIAGVQVGIAKQSKGGTSISSYQPHRSKTNVVAKNESSTVKPTPVYVIDSSSGNSFSADNNKKDLSDSVDIIEPRIAKLTYEDNLSKLAKSKGKPKSIQKFNDKPERLSSSVNTSSKAKRTVKSKQNRQNCIEYENMQVVGYRMLDSGAYECVLIGKDKRRCSVIFEQCNVEITKQSFWLKYLAKLKMNFNCG